MIGEKDFFEKKVFIFDVDGTLYSQRKMHYYMALRLIIHLIIHPSFIKNIRMIGTFRRLREKEEYKFLDIEKLCEVVAEIRKSNTQIVYGTIVEWMYSVPLEYINRCAYREVVAFIQESSAMGKKVILYSDYPLRDKASKLAVPFDWAFTPGVDGIPCETKPSALIMGTILDEMKKTGTDTTEVLYIGDRFEKDGESAKLISVEYLDIVEFRKLLALRT